MADGGAIGRAGAAAIAGGGDPVVEQLRATNDIALKRTMAVNAETADFQSKMEALKAVSEALNAAHEANMQTLDKVGRAAG